MIPDEKIAEIRERADIAEVIGDYVTLKRTGSNLKGVCPFHADTDPSFSVNPARQFFHCFGCGASGDVFLFVQKIEGLEFIESAKRLAARYSIELPEKPMSARARTQAERNREATRRRHYLYEEATKFFEQNLRTPAGQAAVALLKSRDIDGETAKKYRLGYAADAWQGLIEYFNSKKVGPKELSDAGLALPRKSSGFYDRFRNRLMFTIVDGSGQPIAFSGRVLPSDNDDPGAKYINSPETPEYTKGKVLYGLHQARVPISKAKEVILVEGNFDVVSLARAGIENVVAPLGTALTEDQAGLLRRRVDAVSVMFDGDAAGRKAAARAFPVLAKAGLASYLVHIPVGEDPDSLVRKGGIAAVQEAIEKRRGLLDHIISAAAATHDGSVQDISRKIEGLRPYLDALRGPMERDLYKKKVAETFGVSPESVFKYLRGGTRQVQTTSNTSSGGQVPGRIEERELVGVLLDCPNLLDTVLADGTISYVTTPPIRKLLDDIASRQIRKESSIGDLISRTENTGFGSWLASRAMVKLYEDDEKAKRALFDIQSKLSAASIKGRIDELENQIRLAASAGDDEKILMLSREKVNLQRKSKVGDEKMDRLFDVEASKA